MFFSFFVFSLFSLFSPVRERVSPLAAHGVETLLRSLHRQRERRLKITEMVREEDCQFDAVVPIVAQADDLDLHLLSLSHGLSRSSSTSPPPLSSSHHQSVTLHTSLGDLKLELRCDATPLACENFLALAASGAYDGTIFHRNIKGFMVQGGDPTGTGKGGRSIFTEKPDGKFGLEVVLPALRHDARGVLSMANSGKPDSNGSQFFITYKACPHLDGRHTVFGKVIGGFDTLDKMERARVAEKDRPVEEIRVEGVTIHANPLAR